MHQHLFSAATVVAASSTKQFHIGPWIIVPILILIALMGTPVYLIRDRRKRRASQLTR